MTSDSIDRDDRIQKAAEALVEQLNAVRSEHPGAVEAALRDLAFVVEPALSGSPVLVRQPPAGRLFLEGPLGGYPEVVEAWSLFSALVRGRDPDRDDELFPEVQIPLRPKNSMVFLRFLGWFFLILLLGVALSVLLLFLVSTDVFFLSLAGTLCVSLMVAGVFSFRSSIRRMERTGPWVKLTTGALVLPQPDGDVRIPLERLQAKAAALRPRLKNNNNGLTHGFGLQLRVELSPPVVLDSLGINRKEHTRTLPHEYLIHPGDRVLMVMVDDLARLIRTLQEKKIL